MGDEMSEIVNQEAFDQMTTINLEQCRHLARHGYPEEWDHWWNDNNRRMIELFQDAYGDLWLGRINLYRPCHEKILWQARYQEDDFLNFCAAFMIPEYDQKLFDLILARHDAPWINTRSDAVMLDPILDRVTELHGIQLLWV